MRLQILKAADRGDDQQGLALFDTFFAAANMTIDPEARSLLGAILEDQDRETLEELTADWITAHDPENTQHIEFNVPS